jgi:peptide/nickel transport system substrate-binding protein
MFFARLAALALLAVSLGSPASALSSTAPVVVGKTFLAGSTDPTGGSTAWALTSHGISEKLFTVDKHGEIVGQVAQSVKKVSEFVWEVTLKSGYKFSDGTVVDATHVAACLTELNQKNSAAQSSLATMTVTAPSSLVVRIQSTRATHVMDAVLAEWVFVVYYTPKSGTNTHVFTGPYAVNHFAKNDHIDLKPNPFYAKAGERPNIEIKKFSDGYKLAAAFENNAVDVGFHLPIDQLPAVRKMKGVTVKSFEVGYHYMAFHNIRKPHMADARVRKALDLAIDRSALVTSLAGGRGTRSLFPDFTPYFLDTSSPKGDASGAMALLDEAGWKLSNGKRMKGGEELTIHLVAYPQRPGLVIMQPVIAQSLKALGITVNVTTTSGASWDQLDKIIADKDFDLLMWAQNTLPAGDPLWFLNSFFRTGGGSNHAGFASAKVDALLDALSVAEAHTARVAASKSAQAAILAEVPVSNLVTPAWHIGLSARMAEYTPWGSDYYVIRADLHEVGKVAPPKIPESGISFAAALPPTNIVLVALSSCTAAMVALRVAA